MMSVNDLKSILSECGVVLSNGHFIYRSGLHGSTYINKDALYDNERAFWIVSRCLAEIITPFGVETIVAPESGGVKLARQTKFHLDFIYARTVAVVSAVKDDQGTFSIIDGDSLLRRKRVAVIEDVVNTGGTVIKVLDSLRSCNAQVMIVAAIWNRGKTRLMDFPHVYSFQSLITEELPSWTAEECSCLKSKI